MIPGSRPSSPPYIYLYTYKYISTYLHIYTQREREFKWTDTGGAAEARFMLQHTGSKSKELRMVARDRPLFSTESAGLVDGRRSRRAVPRVIPIASYHGPRLCLCTQEFMLVKKAKPFYLEQVFLYQKLIGVWHNHLVLWPGRV